MFISVKLDKLLNGLARRMSNIFLKPCLYFMRFEIKNYKGKPYFDEINSNIKSKKFFQRTAMKISMKSHPY